MATNLSREDLFSETDKTLKAITSEAFLKSMSTFRKTKPEERPDFAKKFMTASALEAQGAPIPKDMRLSSRVFDDSPHFDAVADYDGGKAVLKAVLQAKPDAMATLQKKSPKIYQDLVEEYLPKGLTISPDISPDDPGFITPFDPGFGDPKSPIHIDPMKPWFDPDIDPYSVNGCAGGGGLTFCGCAGGGT